MSDERSADAALRLLRDVLNRAYPAMPHHEALNIISEARAILTDSRAKADDDDWSAHYDPNDPRWQAALAAVPPEAERTEPGCPTCSKPFLIRDMTQDQADWAYLVGKVAKERDDALADVARLQYLRKKAPAAQGRALTVDAAAASLPDNPELDAIRRRVERYAQRFRTGQSSECAKDREALLRLVDGLRIVARLAADSGVPAEPLTMKPETTEALDRIFAAEAGEVAPPAADE